MYIVKKTFEIAGAHRLSLSYESKCTALHGHNWVITVWCSARELNTDGMVVDFSHIKKAVHDYLDHGCLNDLLPFNPTAENLARWIAGRVPHCYRVDVEESASNTATYIDDSALALAGFSL